MGLKGKGCNVMEEVVRSHMIISAGWGAVGARVGAQPALGSAAEAAGSWHPGKGGEPCDKPTRHPTAWTAAGTGAVSPFSSPTHFSSRSFLSKSCSIGLKDKAS